MKKHIFAVPILTLLSLPSLASNFYLLTELGQSKYDYTPEGYLDFLSFEENGVAFGVGAGYQFNEYVALELAYRDLGRVANTYRENYEEGNYQQLRQSLNMTAGQISAVATYPLNKQFSIYGRAGYANLDLDSSIRYESKSDLGNRYERDDFSDSEQKTILGFGANYSISPNMTLRGEYNEYAEWKDEGVAISSFHIGLTYQL